MTARSSGVPWAPNTLFMAICRNMKEQPSSGLAKYSTVTEGKKNGSVAAKASTARPIITGRRGPSRSISRPAVTERNIGSTANSASSTPTVSSEAPSLSANSVVVMRLPTKHRCPRTFSRMK